MASKKVAPLKGALAEVMAERDKTMEDIARSALNDPSSWSYARSFVPFHDNGQPEIDVFEHVASNPAVMSQFLKRSRYTELALYVGQEERLPLDFASNDDAIVYLEKLRTDFLEGLTKKTGRNHMSRTSLTLEEAILVMKASRLGMMVNTEDSVDTIYIYDYDRRMYTASRDVFRRFYAALTNKASSTDVKTFIETLSAYGSQLAIYRELPGYKIAVKNGVFNCLTGALEPAKPYQFYTSRIDTDYVENPFHPNLQSGKTYEELVSDLAIGREDRMTLFHQMMMCVLTGFNPFSAIFCLVGSGGDGKSLMTKLMSNIVGGDNVKSMSFPDFADKDAIFSASQKMLILGGDNPPHINLAKCLHFLKSMSSHESIGITPKYMPSINVRFRGTIVQVMNSIPNFGEVGESMRRRLVTLLCEASHTSNGTNIEELEFDIENVRLHEYILSGYLNQRFIPFFSDLVRPDDDVMDQHLTNSNTVFAFFEYLADSGAFDDVQIVPKVLIPGLYRAYMADHYSDQNPKVSSTLYSEAQSFLKARGFVQPKSPSGGLKRSRLSSLLRQDDSFVERVSLISDSFTDVLDDVAMETMADYYLRDESLEVMPVHRAQRSSFEPVSRFEFFGVRQPLMNDVSQHYEAYRPVVAGVTVDSSVDVFACDHEVELVECEPESRLGDVVLDVEPVVPVRDPRAVVATRESAEDFAEKLMGVYREFSESDDVDFGRSMVVNDNLSDIAERFYEFSLYTLKDALLAGRFRAEALPSSTAEVAYHLAVAVPAVFDFVDPRRDIFDIVSD